MKIRHQALVILAACLLVIMAGASMGVVLPLFTAAEQRQATELLRERTAMADRRLNEAKRAQAAVEELRDEVEGVFGTGNDLSQTLAASVAAAGGRILRSEGGAATFDADLELPEDKLEDIVLDLENHRPPMLILSLEARRIGEQEADGTVIQVRILAETLVVGDSPP